MKIEVKKKNQNIQTAWSQKQSFLKRKALIVTNTGGKHTNNDFFVVWEINTNLIFTVMLKNKAL